MVGRSARIAGAVLRAPALHFLALGALLAAGAARLGGAGVADVRPPIVISAARVDEIRDEYQQSALTAPTDDELRALVAHDADEEMLYHEALLLGLDRGDRAVKFRIVDKMHFLYGDAAGDVETAYRRGLALGLQRDDVVVKNTMVTKMRLLAKAASRSEEPSGAALDAALQAYLEAHAEAYATAARMTVTQVFVSAERHGTALARDADALAAHLRTAAVPPADAVRLGDPFVAGATFTRSSRDALAKIFGAELAAAVVALPTGRWSDPIASPYGLHVVQVVSRDDLTVPPLAAVRSRVLLAYRAERRAQYLDRMMAEVRAAYDVRVERRG